MVPQTHHLPLRWLRVYSLCCSDPCLHRLETAWTTATNRKPGPRHSPHIRVGSSGRLHLLARFLKFKGHGFNYRHVA